MCSRYVFVCTLPYLYLVYMSVLVQYLGKVPWYQHVMDQGALLLGDSKLAVVMFTYVRIMIGLVYSTLLGQENLSYVENIIVSCIHILIWR